MPNSALIARRRILNELGVLVSPADSRQKKPTPRLSDQLRDFIANAPISRNRLASETNLDPATISRFMSGTGGLSTAGLDEIAHVLGLRLAKADEG